MAFKLNQTGIAELAASPGIRAMIDGKVQKVLAEAIATAPFDPTSGGPHFKDSFGAEVDVAPTGIGRTGAVPRVIGRVFSDDPESLHIELGTGPQGSRTPRHRTLGHALGAAR